jgi:hypothetical protein
MSFAQDYTIQATEANMQKPTVAAVSPPKHDIPPVFRQSRRDGKSGRIVKIKYGGQV